jgi:hypothetical protein
MLIGRDFLKRYNVIIDNGRDVITLNKPKDIQANVQSNLQNQTNSTKLKSNQEISCTVLNTTTIKANSERFVKCVVNQSVGEKTILFCPDQSEESSVFGAYSVNMCNKNGEIYVSVINTTNKPVIFNEDSKLGVANTDFSLIQNSLSIESSVIPKLRQFLYICIV